MIKFLVMDVDGTLTDGKIYMAPSGELFKAFDIKDGCGIKDILPAHNIIPVIITARNSDILTRRCEELNIIELHQGIRNKFKKLEQILAEYNCVQNTNYSLKNCAYIGDDILDLNCMKPVKESGGIVGCPSDAVEEIRNMADFVSDKQGGTGAVRDFIEYLIKID